MRPIPSPQNLAEASGLRLDAYRREHLQQCVARALQREGVRDLAALTQLLATNPAARTRFRRTVAVSTSGLFRDPEQLRELDRAVLPGLVTGSPAVRVWSAGCAGGEEVYTLAMMMEWTGGLQRATFLGSDVLDESIGDAERGIVGSTRIPAPLKLRSRFELRDLTCEGPPDGSWHLVICRGVAPQLTDAARHLLTQTLSQALAPGGVLVIGRGETIDDPGAVALSAEAPSRYRKRS